MGTGENVVLGLVEYLTPIVSFDVFMDDCFTSFRLLTHLRVNNIRATRALSKSRLSKCTILGDKQLKKKKHSHFEQRASRKKTVQL